MEKEFKRVLTARDLIISLALIIAGGVLVAIKTSASVNIVGFFMIFAGLIFIMVLRSGYKLVETGEIYKKKERYFAQSLKDSIMTALSSSPESISLHEEDKGNGIRIDVYYSRKNGLAYCRAYEYIPYRYEPCSQFYEYKIEKVEKLIK